MNPNDAQELIQRLRRIETRLHRVVEHFQIEQPSAQAPVVVLPGPVLDLPGYDITLARLRRVLEAAGIDPDSSIELSIKGTPHARVVFF